MVPVGWAGHGERGCTVCTNRFSSDIVRKQGALNVWIIVGLFSVIVCNGTFFLSEIDDYVSGGLFGSLQKSRKRKKVTIMQHACFGWPVQGEREMSRICPTWSHGPRLRVELPLSREEKFSFLNFFSCVASSIMHITEQKGCYYEPVWFIARVCRN